MRKIIYLSIVMLLVSLTCFAKEEKDSTQKKNELAFSINGSFSMSNNLSYSRWLYKNRFINLGFHYSASFLQNIPRQQTTFVTESLVSEITVDLGFIKNKSIKNNIEFRYGFNFIYSYRHSASTEHNPGIPLDQRTNKSFTNKYGIGYKFGVYYQFSNSFSFGGYANPNLSFSNYTNQSIISRNFYFAPFNPFLSVIYKF